MSEFLNTIRMIAFSFSFPKHDKDKASSKFFYLARMAQFGSQALCNYRIGTMLGKFVEVQKPRFVMHTLRSHGKNPLFIPKNSPQTKIIGYQHAVIFPGKSLILIMAISQLQTSFVRRDNNTTDLIKELLFNYKKIIALGSCRAGNVIPPKLTDTSGICLFVPENRRRDKIMIDVGVNAAKKYPRVNFVLRLHPVIKPSLRKKILRVIKFSPENFRLSNAPLGSDLKSSWVCYRGHQSFPRNFARVAPNLYRLRCKFGKQQSNSWLNQISANSKTFWRIEQDLERWSI